VVVCVHGLSRNSRDFDYLARDLQRKCRVVCMDVVGRGDSDWLEDKSGYSFRTYLYDAAALIARVTTAVRRGFFGIGRRATRLDWVGTSMGGLIGLLLAARPNSPIRRLVLNDVGPFVPWDALFRLKGQAPQGASFRSAAEAERYLREACAGFGLRSKGHWRHLVRHSVRKQKDGRYALRYDPAIGRAQSQWDRELPLGAEFMRGVDVWPAWSQVRCPVLVLRGAESDVLTSATVAEMRKRKPDVQVVEFPGVGHAPALFDSDQIKVVRRFLLR
jgi:pimeloyl-ACP methyl ester carboxylesterase